MIPKKFSNLVFTLIMGFGMSLLTPIITYINIGMDGEFIDRFLKASNTFSNSNNGYFNCCSCYKKICR